MMKLSFALCLILLLSGWPVAGSAAWACSPADSIALADTATDAGFHPALSIGAGVQTRIFYTGFFALRPAAIASVDLPLSSTGRLYLVYSFYYRNGQSGDGESGNHGWGTTVVFKWYCSDPDTVKLVPSLHFGFATPQMWHAFNPTVFDLGGSLEKPLSPSLSVTFTVHAILGIFLNPYPYYPTLGTVTLRYALFH